MSLVHGGNVYEVAAKLGCSPEAILDFSASINPLGPPPGLQDAFNRYFRRLEHYPDIRNRSLIDAITRFHGVSQEQVVVGNGSTELIYCLPRALGVRRAVMALPTFGEYRKAFELQGVELTRLVSRQENHFQPAVDQLDAACRDGGVPDALLVTHPGSPSGTLLSASFRDRLVETCRERSILCIVDEVFIDFCEEESLKGLLKDAPGFNLVLIRSMTKFYGIPGLRLGYLLASESAASRVRELLPPWSVNTLAQIAGEHCFSQDAYRKETLELVRREREQMRKELDALRGINTIPGMANYLLLELDASLPPASVLQRDILASDRILVRDCSSFDGMDDRFVRVAIRRPAENRRLVDAFKRWVEAL